MEENQVSKIKLKVDLVLTRLAIIKLMHGNHGYEWSCVDEIGKEVIKKTLIEIDELLKQL